MCVCVALSSADKVARSGYETRRMCHPKSSFVHDSQSFSHYFHTFTQSCQHLKLCVVKRRKTVHIAKSVIFKNNRLTIGAYSSAIQNVYNLLLIEFRHMIHPTFI